MLRSTMPRGRNGGLIRNGRWSRKVAMVRSIQVPTSDVGLKRNADQISSIDICVTGLHSLLGNTFHIKSRLISVGILELCFGYEIQSRPPGCTSSIALGISVSTSALLRTN